MYRTFIRRALIGSVAVASALVVAGCGVQSDHGSDHSSQSSKDFNDADVMFAQMMIPHHEQAVEMSDLAETRVNDADVGRIAAAIKKAQGPEIETMTTWLKDWDQPTEAPGHDMGDDGMVADKDMKKLANSSGTDFDELYVELMIGHHNGAVDMAEDERNDGKNSEAKKLAKTIVKTQSDEIDELNAILEKL